MHSTALTPAVVPIMVSLKPATWPDLQPLAIESHWLRSAAMAPAHRLLVVYPHPDDETFSSGGTIARYSLGGVEVHYVCATRGECGTIEPRLRGEESAADLRTAELVCAAQTLGLTAIHFLGYRDSGMPGAVDAQHPDAFVAAPMERVTGQLVALIRAIRPQVVITFGPYGDYGHPDHIHIHETTRAAFTAAGNPEYSPRCAPAGLTPWAAAKLYYKTFDARPVRLAVTLLRLFGRDPRRFGENGDVDLLAVATQVTPPTCTIDVGPWLAVKDRAFWCHRTQLGSLARLQRLPRRLRRPFVAAESYTRAVPPVAPDDPRERDLFHGLALAPIPVGIIDQGGGCSAELV